MSEQLRKYAKHLETCRAMYDEVGDCDCGLEQALAQEEKQEPVAYIHTGDLERLETKLIVPMFKHKPNVECMEFTRLYTSPPKVVKL